MFNRSQTIDTAAKERGIGGIHSTEFFASHRMAANKGDAGWQQFFSPFHNLGFGAGDISNNGSRRKRSRELLQQGARRANGRSDDDQVRAEHGITQGGSRLIDS